LDHTYWIFCIQNKEKCKIGEILDFSHLNLRKEFCQKEVILNRPLCGDMYQKVVKIVYDYYVYKIVDLDQKGKAVEYALKC
jgi:aminoglycoside phosphotransferase family enzyme